MMQSARVETVGQEVTRQFITPRYFFLASGTGDAARPLCAFDRALLSAGVGDVNLLRLSSILPPRCTRIPPLRLPEGCLVPVAYAAITSEEPGSQIAAAVAVALPRDEDEAGLVMEYSGVTTRQEAERIAAAMAEENMAYRNRPVARLLTASVEHMVETAGSAFACVVMLP